MIQNKEEKFTYLNLLFIGRLLLSAVYIQLLQEEKNSLNKEKVLPSFIANVVSSNFLLEKLDN
jgi:hypothetical protein